MKVEQKYVEEQANGNDSKRESVEFATFFFSQWLAVLTDN